MWKLLGMMLGGGAIPREANRRSPRRSRPKSIDQIGDKVGCVSLCISVGLLAIGIALGGGAIPREAARAPANNGCLPILLVLLVAILICVVLMACGIFELRIEFKR